MLVFLSISGIFITIYCTKENGIWALSSVITLPLSSRKDILAMNRYEVLMLTIPEITKDEVSSIESQVDRLVGESQGNLISFERWGKYRLAYPVKKNDYGVYFLTRFEVEKPAKLLEELKSLFTIKFNEQVMRFMSTRLDEKASLEYERPLSLEETPKRRVGSLFEGKGKSLLSTTRSSRQETREAAPQATEKPSVEQAASVEPTAQEAPAASVETQATSEEA